MLCGGERRASKHCGRTICASGIPTVRAARLGRHCGLDGGEECFQFVRSIVAYPINEEGRCAIHSTSYPAQEILAHTIRMHVLNHLALEPLFIKMECDSIVD